MSNNWIETWTDKFPHLGNIPPKIELITNLDMHDVKTEHLWKLDEHLWGLQKEFPSIANEIETTRAKIRIAMWLEPNISKEVFVVSNNINYDREYRRAA